MRVRKDDAGLGFNLWNVQGTWFWSLVYPDRHGGAIGAAATEAEAVDEARKTIELALELRGDHCVVLRRCNEPRPAPVFPTIGENCGNIWQRLLRQYAARVAAA